MLSVNGNKGVNIFKVIFCLYVILSLANILKWQMKIVLSKWRESILKTVLPRVEGTWLVFLPGLGNHSWKWADCCGPAELATARSSEHEHDSGLLGRVWHTRKEMVLQTRGVWGGDPNTEFIFFNCVFILTCLNLQSSLHLIQFTYWDGFSTAQNSFWTCWVWCPLVLLLFSFVSLLPHLQNISLWGLFSSGEIFKKSLGEGSGE